MAAIMSSTDLAVAGLTFAKVNDAVEGAGVGDGDGAAVGTKAGVGEGADVEVGVGVGVGEGADADSDMMAPLLEDESLELISLPLPPPHAERASMAVVQRNVDL
jgi:hypothetical protein